jgi:hypothetical protein
MALRSDGHSRFRMIPDAIETHAQRAGTLAFC